MTKNLALELAPVRVNLIAAGFVDTPLSAALLGEELETRASNSGRRCRSGARIKTRQNRASTDEMHVAGSGAAPGGRRHRWVAQGVRGVSYIAGPGVEPHSWLSGTSAGLPVRCSTLICGNSSWAGSPWMVMPNGWVKSVVEPLTSGK